MKKAVGFSIVLVGLLLSGGVALYFYIQSVGNPYHQGRRVREWARIAIQDPDPAARREATSALCEAFKTMRRGEPRVQLTSLFCGPSVLPREVLPFLLEALHAREMWSMSYPCLALAHVESEAAVPALVNVVLHDVDAHAREGAMMALANSKGKKAGADAFRQAVGDGSPDVRLRAAAALKRLEKEH